jgi:hypothetical protein
MRPLRSFLLLLIFLACFTGLHYFIPANQLFPSISEFVSIDLVNRLLSENKPHEKESIKPIVDSVKAFSSATGEVPVDSVPETVNKFKEHPFQENS